MHEPLEQNLKADLYIQFAIAVALHAVLDACARNTIYQGSARGTQADRGPHQAFAPKATEEH